jgi:hypothetical protein
MSALCYARVIAPALPFIAAAPALAQPCAPFWANAGSTIIASPSSHSLHIHSDGGAAWLYAAVITNQAEAVRWNGEVWENISAGLPLPVSFRNVDLRRIDLGAGPRIVALGTLGSNPQQWWGRVWDGAQWQPTPAGFVAPDGTAFPALSTDLGDGVRVYGYLYNWTTGYYRVARWSGTQWEPISEPFFQSSFKFVAFDDGSGTKLYMLGTFTLIGSVQMQGFARWLGGTTWERPPSNVLAVGTTYDVVVFDDGGGPAIFAHSEILAAPEQRFPGVGRYRNGVWENLGGPALCSNCVYSRSRLAVFDDGSGPALYVTGGFNNWGGIEARGIVRWNGKHWSPVIRGVFQGSEVRAMVAGDGPHGYALYVGGLITQAGAGTVRYVAEYKGCPNCYANCDHSSIAPALNVRDFMCFINKFAEDDPYANCDGSTDLPGLTIADFACYLNKFAAGCP